MTHSIESYCTNNDKSFDTGDDTGCAARSFSVVIPLYNKAAHIEKTIQSVLAQTFLPLEIIVVDDGSTDRGADIVAEKFADRVQLIRQKNAGVSAARNSGIAIAKGTYIAFLDADDLWSVHFLEELNSLAKRHPKLAMLATSYQYLVGDLDYQQPKIRQSSTMRKNILSSQKLENYFEVASNGDLPFCASSVAIKRNFFDLHGGFPTREPMGEDQCMWSRVALRSDIAYSPRGLSFYNVAATNRACQATPPSGECPFSRRLLTFATNAESLTEIERQSILRYTAAHLLDLANKNIQAGHWAQAKALLADPRCKLKPAKAIKTTIAYYAERLFDLIGVKNRRAFYLWQSS